MGAAGLVMETPGSAKPAIVMRMQETNPSSPILIVVIIEPFKVALDFYSFPADGLDKGNAWQTPMSQNMSFISSFIPEWQRHRRGSF
jgi:hypothetical protein